MTHSWAERIIRSREGLVALAPAPQRSREAAEGGCGVLGLAANIPIAGRHVMAAVQQMHNRGNGKGGGIAMVGLCPAQVGVDEETLRTHYLLQIALLDPSARTEIEEQFIYPHFAVAVAYELPHLPDHREVGLEVRPPDVWRYFVRARPEALERFAAEKGLAGLPPRAVEDEFVYQNSYRLNVCFYASLGEKRAFVLSHGHNLSVLKIVGYAEQVIQYYGLEDQVAHVWIGHQRYPTKGRVWHPGGAHPFIGLHEALVHNGDFANYHAVCEYLRQRGVGQLFLTDTEIGVQLFDLMDRVYGYPLEVTLEAIAPTTEHDFQMLPPERRELYRIVQRTHLHASPDGPWFFIVARSRDDRYELLGITDTSMLRPQVFALFENEVDGERVQMGLIASERQAINACLRSLAAEDPRFRPLADHYWVARGGSHTDGGAFRFVVIPTPAGPARLTCTDKFGKEVQLASGYRHAPAVLNPARAREEFRREWEGVLLRALDNGGPLPAWEELRPLLATNHWDDLAWGLRWLADLGRQGLAEWHFAREVLTLLRDRRTDLGDKRRASFLTLVDETLGALFAVPGDGSRAVEGGMLFRLTWETRHILGPAPSPHAALILDTLGFPPEGEESAARWMVRAYRMGWRHIVAYNWRGGRFAACGLGPNTCGVRIDLYGDVGDYAASGLDGAEVYLHGDGQDQLGQILKDGKLVVYGDVGQTFLYGAKGGEVYVLGSAAGRPLINGVGRPRVVINGTCLDYLAESFMAGDPRQGGGFVVLNGVTFSPDGRLEDLPSPYPGGNLFSLATGGAIFLRDPYRVVDEDQLNGGVFAPFTEEDWHLIEPYLRENERLFGISIADLLTVGGALRSPAEVYRKVVVDPEMAVLADG
ncbi:MAG: glutamate synthase [Thermoflexales bacterium]|nr:glutamate synthase [Thermoflexales bacterium]